MATASHPISPSCCFALRHSEACRQIKQNTALIMLAVAIIGTVGAVLGVLALQGFNLGGINALIMLAGEHSVYLTLIGSASLLLITITLVASIARSSGSKQLTQREVDRLNLQGWLEEEMIVDKLQPGQFWDFPEQYRYPEGNRPAVFGMVVKNREGTVGVYAFKTADAAAAKKLELRDGQEAFSTSETYPRSYISKVVVNQNQLQALEERPLKEGEYLSQTFDKIYAARRVENGEDLLRFFKQESTRARFIHGFDNRDRVEEQLRRKMGKEITHLPPNTFWCLQNGGKKHAVCWNDGKKLQSLYYNDETERDAMAQALRQEGYTSARAQKHASSHTSGGSWDSSRVVFL